MKNPMQHPDPRKFLFAWADFSHGKLTYHAASQTLQIFSSTDWQSFHAKTGLFCHRLRAFTDGRLKRDATARIYTHEKYVFNFYISGKKIELAGEEEIEFFNLNAGPDTEKLARNFFWNND